MAQFKAFDKNVEVNGQTVLSVVNSLNFGKESRLDILAQNGIENPESGKWYKQQLWLNAFQEIHKVLGDNTLFMIGKAIPQNADFPKEIDTLRKALLSVDTAYHMNHRGGEIGNYQLVAFDEQNRKAVMICNNPYPSEFDRGILTSMVRKFRPKDSYKCDVVLDVTKASRLEGGESCTYLITW
ncbi:hypothetical protein AAG747_25150 [Rapidithrix thailandica]|uniref:Uncharacterized protein n=1 Tax=Rapidithrix thailandica TaxID=413964 RepID=A0AAW9S7Q4_9BACT